MSWRREQPYEIPVAGVNLAAYCLRTTQIRPCHAHQRPATARYGKPGSTPHAQIHETYKPACGFYTSAMEGNSKVSKRKCAKGNPRGTLGRYNLQEGDL